MCRHGQLLCYHRSLVSRCARCLDSLLQSLLVDAGLTGYSSGSEASPGFAAADGTAAQLPTALPILQNQLAKACSSRQTPSVSDIVSAIKQLSSFLVRYCKQQQEQRCSESVVADCMAPSADAVVNILSIVLFSKASGSNGLQMLSTKAADGDDTWQLNQAYMRYHAPAACLCNCWRNQQNAVLL